MGTLLLNINYRSYDPNFQKIENYMSILKRHEESTLQC